MIPNGVDPRRFRPDPRAQGRLRASLGIAADAPVIAFAARYDAMKDVPLFLASAARFLARHANAHVLMCGSGMTPDNPKPHDPRSKECQPQPSPTPETFPATQARPPVSPASFECLSGRLEP